MLKRGIALGCAGSWFAAVGHAEPIGQWGGDHGERFRRKVEIHSCDDGARNGDEVAVDCGGSECDACVSVPISSRPTIFTDWGSGYCYGVEVTNSLEARLTDWSVSVDLQGTEILHAWNAKLSGATGLITLRPGYEWNATLEPGESDASIGFCASRPPGALTALTQGAFTLRAPAPAPPIQPALNGPRSLAPGGIALFEIPPEAALDLATVLIGETEYSAADGEHVQLVRVPPELDNPAPSDAVEPGVPALVARAASSRQSSAEPLALAAPGMEARTLSALALPAEALRVAVRVPTRLISGTESVYLTTNAGTTYRWSFSVVAAGVFVPPSPAGIVLPSGSYLDPVYPIGTQGPYYPLTDPITTQPPIGSRPVVIYDFRLRTFEGETCAQVAPKQGLIVGHEDITDAGVNPIRGFYDVENGNFIEVTIDRTPVGGVPELYRGGWITGDMPLDPAARGQLPPPQPGPSFVALRSVTTGLPLVFNYFSRDVSFEEACPDLAASGTAFTEP